MPAYFIERHSHDDARALVCCVLPDARAALRMMTRIQDLICPQCKVGSGGHTVGCVHQLPTEHCSEPILIAFFSLSLSLPPTCCGMPYGQ